MTLAEFLLARITEREALAREAIPDWLEGTPWYAPDVYDTGVQNIAIGEDPRRVLARCEADRRIVEEYVDICKWDTDAGDDHGIHGQRMGLEFAVKSLAAACADHPDYREEWKP